MPAAVRVVSCRSCGAALARTDRSCKACRTPAPPSDETAQARAPWEIGAPQPSSSRPGASTADSADPQRPLYSAWSAAATALEPGSAPSLPSELGRAPRILGIPEPWFFLLLGLALAPVLTFTPILRYMGWFLGSLFHETGHAAIGWLLGCPTVPAIRIDGHAAAIHGEPSTLLRIGWMAVLALVLWRMRARPVARVILGVALLAYPAIAFTEAREVVFLLAGHLGEAAFATVLLLQALDGGFSGTAEERATHAMVGWYLVWRNVTLCAGLVTKSAARGEYADNGSFGLVNDYLRLSHHIGVGLESIALVMLVVALLPVPIAILLEHIRARRG